jgi:hypothetical protein
MCHGGDLSSSTPSSGAEAIQSCGGDIGPAREESCSGDSCPAAESSPAKWLVPTPELDNTEIHLTIVQESDEMAVVNSQMFSSATAEKAEFAIFETTDVDSNAEESSGEALCLSSVR